MKLYTIEIRHKITSDKEYRFVSLLNGMRGIWYNNEKTALLEGDSHAEMLSTIYPTLNRFV